MTKYQKFILNYFALVGLITNLASYSTYSVIPYLDILSTLSLYLVIVISWRNYTKLFDKNNIKVGINYSIMNLIILCYPIFIYFEAPFVKDLTNVWFILLFVFLAEIYRKYVFDRFILFLSIILVLGCIEYIFIYIANSPIIISEVNRGEGYVALYQTIFNIIPYYWESGFRFQSITNEPGVVGTICAFCIFFIDYRQHPIKWLIFIISGFITFSLAFYVFFIINLLFIVLKTKPKYSLLILIASLCLYVSFSQPVNELIFQRLSQEKIDNRSSEAFNKAFKELNTTPKLFYGNGNSAFLQDWEGGNAGIKVRIYQYGYVGSLLIIISFAYLIFHVHRNRGLALIVFLLFLISSYQRFWWNSPAIAIILLSYSLNFIKPKLPTIQ